MNTNILEKTIKIPDTHVSVRKRKKNQYANKNIYSTYRNNSLRVSRRNNIPNYLKSTISTENKKSCKYSELNTNNTNTLRRTSSVTNLRRNIKNRSKMTSPIMTLRNEYYDEYNQFNNETFGDDPYNYFS